MFLSKLYAVSFVLFTVIDVIWLRLIAKNFFTTRIGHLMADNPKLIYAAIFYLAYPLAIIYLVLLSSSSAKEALLKGLALGAVSYGTYELTNQTILKNWPIYVTVIDTLWGTVLTGLVCFLTYLIIKI